MPKDLLECTQTGRTWMHLDSAELISHRGRTTCCFCHRQRAIPSKCDGHTSRWCGAFYAGEFVSVRHDVSMSVAL